MKTHEERSQINRVARLLSTTQYYATADDMMDKINEYFDQCFAYETDKKSGKMRRFIVNSPTRAGLVLYLGFPTYRQMQDFCEKSGERYQEVHDFAITMLEDYLEGTLVTTKYNPKGPELALKNICGWEDKSTKEIQAKGTVGMVCGWAAKPLKGTVLDDKTKRELGMGDSEDAEDAEVVTKEENTDAYSFAE